MRLTIKLWDENFTNKLTRRLPVGTKECVHCGKYILNAKYRFHLLIHSYEKPFQCFLCHHRFLDRSYLESHMSLFHKKDDSIIIGTLSPDVTKIARRSSAKMTAPGNQNDRSQNSSIFSSITNWYTKEYYWGTTSEDRAKRYESRKTKLELGVDNNKSLTSARCKIAGNVTSTRKNNKAGLNRSHSPRTIASVKIVPLAVTAETITTDNGVVHCTPCGKVFYELALFKTHWNTEHKRFQNDTYGKSLLAVNDTNQGHPKESLQRNLNVLEENHKKIISSQWSRRVKNKYKKLNTRRKKQKQLLAMLNPTNIEGENFPRRKDSNPSTAVDLPELV